MVKKKAEKPAKRNVAKPYEPTPYERDRMDAYLARREEDQPAPRMTVSKKRGVTPDHPDPATAYIILMEAVGTKNADFLDGILNQLINVSSQSRDVDERQLNFMLSVVEGVKPKDQIETLLAAQMAVVHMATMTFGRRLAQVENIPQQDSAERAFNKLARTFTTQVEALKRYRTGGEQKVTVKHVTVNEGGQAIVGNVAPGGRGATKNGGTTS